MYSRNQRSGWGTLCCLAMGLHALVSLLPEAHGAEGDWKDALPFSKLDLSLRLGKTEYVQGEPIAVYARLVNAHAKPVRAHDRWGWFHRGGTRWEGGEVWLYVELVRDGTTFDLNQPYGMPHATQTPPRASLLPAGAVRRAKQLIVYGDAQVDRFLAPGTLDMTAKLRGLGLPQDFVTSNCVRTSIRAPVERDAEAFDWLRQRKLLPYLGYLLFVREEAKDTQRQSFRLFLDKHGDTAYGPYASFGLGQMYFYSQRYAEAIEVLKGLVERHPKCSVAEDALYLVGECHRQLKNLAEADGWFREVLKRYPDTIAAEDAKAMLAEIAREPAMLFREDRRLDAKITFEVPTATRAEDAFKVVSRLSGVALRVSQGLGDVRCYGGQRTQTVRAFMAEFDRGRHRWLREDHGGYRLVPGVAPK